MNLMFFLHGRKDEIIRNNNLNEAELDIIKIDDKDLANRKLILKEIRKKSYQKIFFATKRLRYQRFLLIMKMYLLITGKNGAIIDKDGNQDHFHPVKYVIFGIPALIIETIASLAIYFWYYFKIFLIRKRVA